jgi:hypothetical protein
MRTIALLLALTATAAAQYTLDWHTMDAGGGCGAVGSFEMRGTLGQPDAFTGAAGPIVLVGGYWSLLDELLPLLRIYRVGPDVVLAWPSPSPGFELQASPDLITGAWNPVTIVPVKIGSEFQVTWGPPIGRHYFRLHRP